MRVRWRPTLGNLALALSVVVNATGAVRLTQVELIEPEEMDAAIAKLPAYRAPGA